MDNYIHRTKYEISRKYEVVKIGGEKNLISIRQRRET